MIDINFVLANFQKKTNSGADSEKFAIDSVTGQMTLKSELNYEEQTSHVITVAVQDNGVPTLSSSCQV